MASTFRTVEKVEHDIKVISGLVIDLEKRLFELRKERDSLKSKEK